MAARAANIPAIQLRILAFILAISSLRVVSSSFKYRFRLIQKNANRQSSTENHQLKQTLISEIACKKAPRFINLCLLPYILKLVW